MILLGIWLRCPDGKTERVGDIAFTDPDQSGRYQAEFRYSQAWLRNAQAFALDPIHLPLADTAYGSQNLNPPLGVIEDALPDDWGRRLLIRFHKLAPRTRSEGHLLAALGADGMGALVFGNSNAGPPAPRQGVESLHLRELMNAAVALDSGESPLAADLQRVLAAGSSPGGSRPKALVHDSFGHWLAKFPSPNRDGRFDVVGLEATCMDLARSAGIPVPETKIVHVGRRKVLLVKRFDIASENKRKTEVQPGRYHCISLKTLCGERTGVYVQTYREVALTLRRATRDLDDIDRFFAQMVFNAAIGNTDDHLKNFWMLRRSDGYVLSPAFDLVPDVAERSEHALAFQYDYRSPDRITLYAIAQEWGVRTPDRMIEAIVKSMANFSTIAKTNKVPLANIREIGGDIAGRVARMLKRGS